MRFRPYIEREANIQIRFHPEWIMYLVIPDWAVVNIRDIIKARPSAEFFDMVNEHVMNFMVDSKEPPAEIASAIMNISDDMMSGREVVFRTGDYIALMNFAKSRKMR